MTGFASSHHCRVYLEGINVPFSGLTITIKAGSPSTSDLTVLPLSSARNIPPRTRLHVFALDPLDQTNYRLIFEGETTGIIYAKETESRICRLTCHDLLNFWDNMGLYWVVKDMPAPDFNQLYAFPAMNDNSGLGVPVPEIAGSDIMKLFSESGSIPGMIRALVLKLYESNEFYRTFAGRWRLSERMPGAALLDSITGRLAKKESFPNYGKYLDALAKQVISSGNILQFANLVLSLVFHEIVSNPSPGFAGGKPLGIYFKPNVYHASPPLCNLIFPSDLSQMSTGRSYLDEITRLKIINRRTIDGEMRPYLGGSLADSGDIMTLSENTYSPPELAKLIKTPDDAYRDYEKLTLEEKSKGIIGMEASPPPIYTTFMENLEDGGKSFLRTTADYQYWLKRFESRICRAVLDFSPDLVPGFPALILDNSGEGYHVAGKIASLTHSLSAATGWMTTVKLSHCRFAADGEEPVFTLKDGRSGPVPDFLEGFDSGNISSLYEPLLGVKSLADHLHSRSLIEDKNDTAGQAHALLKLYERFKKAGTAAIETGFLKRRPIATQRQIFSWLGAAGNGSETEYRGECFDTAGQEAVRRYVRDGLPAAGEG